MEISLFIGANVQVTKISEDRNRGRWKLYKQKRVTLLNENTKINSNKNNIEHNHTNHEINQVLLYKF